MPRLLTSFEAKEALAHEGWLQAMKEELQALEENDTWDLVPKISDMNITGTKWVFKVKYTMLITQLRD